MNKYPRLVINLKKLQKNLETLAEKVHGANCSLAIVTKVFCADKKIVDFLLKSDSVNYLADSRIKNLKVYAGKGKETMLLRFPQLCEIKETVRYANISLNSEIKTIRLLNEEAGRQNKKHKIVFMIDLGDLREGIFFKNEDFIFSIVEEVMNMSNIIFAGLGTNLTCYGAVIPRNENLSQLVCFAQRIEEKYKVKLEIVSGGNSSSYYLIGKGELPKGINNLRLGESFVLGNETAYSTHIDGTYTDAVILEAQVIELQVKPSYPVGEVGVNAFGERVEFVDRGLQKRAILAIGRQDTDADNIVPIDDGIEILGSSSDHLIVSVTNSKIDYTVGDVITFKMHYSAVLRSFTSKYVSRQWV